MKNEKRKKILSVHAGLSLIIIQKQLVVHPNRIYLSGFSQGGSLCYQLAFKYPNLFQGIAPLGAFFRSEFLPEDLSQIRNLSVYIGQGDRDGHLPEVCEAAEILTQSGLKVHFQIYENTGHGIRQPVQDELKSILAFLNP